MPENSFEEIEELIGPDLEEAPSEVEPSDDDAGDDENEEEEDDDAEEEEEVEDAVEEVWPWSVIEEREPWRYVKRTDGNTQGGTLHAIGSDGLKATCKIHPKCACWITLRALEQAEVRIAVEAELIDWLAKGIDATADSHRDQSAQIRMARGMRVRKR